MTLEGTIFITLKDGKEIEARGDSHGLDRLEEILEASGFKWNEEVECWDEGFYETA